MRRAAVLALALVLCAPLAGCRSLKEGYAGVVLEGTTLTYEQFMSIDPSLRPRPTVDDVLRDFGPPAEIHTRDGARRRVVYHAFTFYDHLKRAELSFDSEERLVKKELW